jgi:mono/diheme cytochrome c family protein
LPAPAFAAAPRRHRRCTRSTAPPATANAAGRHRPGAAAGNLERLRQPEALKVIREGRVATQMPAFGDKLSADEAQQLAEWIYRPVTPAPVWGEHEIRGSQVVNADAAKLPAHAGPAG